MFIVFGTRDYRKRLGWVADYCPMCRAIRRCRATEHRQVSHLYFIPVGRSKPTGFEVLCCTCKARLPAEPGRYDGYSRKRRHDLDQLIALTNPQAEERAIGRLEMEERAASGDLSPGERFELLQRPFDDIAPEFEARARSVHLDGRSSRWLLAVILLVTALIVAASTHGIGPVMLYGGIGLSLLALVMLVISLATDPRRFLDRRYRSFIAESLIDLDPSREEIDVVLSALRSRGWTIGRKIDVQWVSSAVRDLQDARRALQ